MKTIVHTQPLIKPEISWHTSISKVLGDAGAFRATVRPDMGHFSATITAPGMAETQHLFATSAAARVWCEQRHHELLPPVADTESNPAIKLLYPLYYLPKTQGIIQPRPPRRRAPLPPHACRAYTITPLIAVLAGFWLAFAISPTAAACLAVALVLFYVVTRRAARWREFLRVVLLALALFGTSRTAQAGPANCAGFVLTTLEDGNICAVANLQLKVTHGPHTLTVCTDNEGRFACRPAPDGSSNVRIQAVGPDGCSILDETLAIALPCDFFRLYIASN